MSAMHKAATAAAASNTSYFDVRPSPKRSNSSSSTSSRGASPSSTSISRARQRSSPLTRPAGRRSRTAMPAPVAAPAVATSTKSNDKAIAFEREVKALLELEYRDDVQDYMYDMEDRTMASVELIDMQPELQWFMRPYLIDFLIEIHQQHALRAETLYLAVNIVDRYVSKRIVFKKHYQLVGCAALWIAAKFEDAKDRVPTVHELALACCNAYEESAFIQMEGHVLSTIGWVLGHPTAEAWLRLASVGFGLEEQKVQHTSRFLMEITLFHRAFVAFKPSDIAVACLMLARFMQGKPYRPEYETDEVLRIVGLLDSHLAEHLDQVSAIVIKKYSYAFYSRASAFAREWYLSGYRFFVPMPPSPTPSSASSHLSSPCSRSSSSSSISSAATSCEPSSPLHSPCSEASFDSCSEYEEPLTPVTPLSMVSLVDSKEQSLSPKSYSALASEHQKGAAVVQDWSDDASMASMH